MNKFKPAADYEHKKWNDDFAWLGHNEAKQVMFCTVCRSFPNILARRASMVISCSSYRLIVFMREKVYSPNQGKYT